MHKILIVEDDVALAKWMADYLSPHSFDIHLIHDGGEASAAIKKIEPDLLILDINLPNKSGFELCKEARNFYQQPIIMLTANDEVVDEILGLELGADDYLTKPVMPRILLARINAQLRRQNVKQQHDNKLEFDDLFIDLDAKNVTLKGEAIKLSSAEFELLWVLASHAGKEILRQDLVKELRGFDYDGFDRTIDVRISRLRKKLFDLDNPPKKIKTIWGKGYLFVSTAWKL